MTYICLPASHATLNLNCYFWKFIWETVNWNIKIHWIVRKRYISTFLWIKIYLSIDNLWLGSNIDNQLNNILKKQKNRRTKKMKCFNNKIFKNEYINILNNPLYYKIILKKKIYKYPSFMIHILSNIFSYIYGLNMRRE